MSEYINRLKSLGYTQDEANFRFAFHMSTGTIDILNDYLSKKEETKKIIKAIID